MVRETEPRIKMGVRVRHVLYLRACSNKNFQRSAIGQRSQIEDSSIVEIQLVVVAWWLWLVGLCRRFVWWLVIGQMYGASAAVCRNLTRGGTSRRQLSGGFVRIAS